MPQEDYIVFQSKELVNGRFEFKVSSRGIGVDAAREADPHNDKCWNYVL
jgi:hypothetical protein